jgi:hypothetical protein
VSAALPFEPGCAECTRLRAAEAAARIAHDHSRAVDYRVLARRHLRDLHGVRNLMVEQA